MFIRPRRVLHLAAQPFGKQEENEQARDGYRNTGARWGMPTGNGQQGGPRRNGDANEFGYRVMNDSSSAWRRSAGQSIRTT
jgi:hypothetical protein